MNFKHDRLICVVTLVMLIGIISPAWCWYEITKYESDDKYQFQIEGTVFQDLNSNGIQDEGEPGIPGVGVSDGREVVITNSNGAYTLTNEQRDANVVFVSVPENSRKGERFYHLLYSDMSKRAFDFQLIPATQSEPHSFSFIQTTDVHIWNWDAIADFKHRIQRMNKIAPDARFIMCTGDLGADNKIETLIEYRDATMASRIPWLNTFGNHDELYQFDYTKNYRYVLGPDYYSFDYGGWHFMVLNSIHLDNHKMNTDWFENDLKTFGNDKPIILFTHFHPEQKHFDLWAKYPQIKAVFSGHLHGVINKAVNNIKSYNTAPFRFAGLDYTPPGFRIIHLDDQNISTEYKLFSNEKMNVESVESKMKNEQVKLNDDSAWNEYKNSPDRTGMIDAKFSLPLTRKWTTQISGSIIFSSPVIKSSRIFIGTRNLNEANEHFLYCLQANDGTVVWRRELPSPILLSPTIDGDNISLQTQNGDACCYSVDGELKWQYPMLDERTTWVFAAPIVRDDVIITGNTSCVAAIKTANGELVWKSIPGNHWDFSNAILSLTGDRLMTGAVWARDNLIALTPDSGIISKKFKSNGISTAVVAVNGAMIVQEYDGTIKHMDNDGNVKWQHTMEGNYWTVITPSVSKDKVIAVSSRGELMCLKLQDGNPLWSLQLNEGMFPFVPYHAESEMFTSSPLLTKKYVLFGASDGSLYILDINSGKIMQQLQFNSPITSTPAVVDHAVFIATFDGCIHAIGD
ncbi:PQQ-binding-like beta-propeller repeat protein [candidate division KSB1 bacterium]|nr:PQQ-binding-like beta-propeller repeat protein [candidate division KSB1 bacterium]